MHTDDPLTCALCGGSHNVRYEKTARVLVCRRCRPCASPKLDYGDFCRENTLDPQHPEALVVYYQYLRVPRTPLTEDA